MISKFLEYVFFTDLLRSGSDMTEVCTPSRRSKRKASQGPAELTQIEKRSRRSSVNKTPTSKSPKPQKKTPASKKSTPVAPKSTPVATKSTPAKSKSATPKKPTGAKDMPVEALKSAAKKLTPAKSRSATPLKAIGTKDTPRRDSCPGSPRVAVLKAEELGASGGRSSRRRSTLVSTQLFCLDDSGQVTQAKVSSPSNK